MPETVEQLLRDRHYDRALERLLLLAGLVWISIGVGFYLVFSEILRHPTEVTRDVPHGLQYVGYGLIGIGISHLIVFAVGLRRES